MKIQASVISHPGSCRRENEDNFCFNGKMLKGNTTRRPIGFKTKRNVPVLMGVFDGMGGLKAGERASFLAAQTACVALKKIKEAEEFDKWQIDICKKANKLVCSEMREIYKQRIGTTASMLCFNDGQYYLCNIGDSPILLFREGKLQTIFQEHTERANQVLVRGTEAGIFQKKYKLTQHIGIFEEEMEIEPFVCFGKLCDGDRFLIASDGLTDMVEEERIRTVLEEKKSSEKTVERLLDDALANGGRDNITIICIDIESDAEKKIRLREQQ